MIYGKLLNASAVLLVLASNTTADSPKPVVNRHAETIIEYIAPRNDSVISMLDISGTYSCNALQSAVIAINESAHAVELCIHDLHPGNQSWEHLLQLKNVQWLILGSSSLNDEQFMKLLELDDIRDIAIVDAPITAKSFDAMTGFRELTRLRVDYGAYLRPTSDVACPLSTADWDVLTRVPKLSCLEISTTSSDDIIDYVAQCTSLRTLHLGIPTVSPEKVRLLSESNIRELHFTNTKIEAHAVEQLAQSKISDLSFTRCWIRGSPFSELATISSLSKLGWFDSNADIEDASLLARSMSLKELKCTWLRPAAEVVPELSKLKKLDVLDLSSMDIRDSDKAHLIRELPSVHIIPRPKERRPTTTAIER